MNKIFVALLICILLISCGQEKPETNKPKIVKEKIVKQFGYTLNDYTVKRDTVKKGDSFGSILENNNLFYPQIYNIVQKAKKVFDVRRINLGKPYTILFSKDSVKTPKVLIYQPNLIDYVVVSLTDSLFAEKKSKAVKLKEFEAEGVITSSLSETMEEKKLSPLLSNELSEIYAWTIDFFRLEKGDNFKIIYSAKFVDDSIAVGLNRIHSAYFEHRGKPFYAIEFETDPKRGLFEYFDENGKNLRRAFLRAPVQFSRISSRYNLKRKIAYYGRVRPHLGTDFAAPRGTPIRATASGTVTKASYTRSNGNYIKIKHNGTYSTQYLHMDKRGVKVGQFVKQGDYIGTVGMTGNTSGPHVCYRFWKNGKQVDPLKQKLPEAKPISKELKKRYLKYMMPVKNQLDSIESITFEKKSIR
ncbi:peptidoglycan DD-metalloendopeptidase family protein [Flavobacteriaceae bacterium]|jgi:murein DD-endopeptidase MepM/ murein hydrolase activator NlpD|nr:peptidoglycan DD-metalloendopeptidase family protein [Flavobacteriaceae bacterium]MDA9257111.1 peptidoglycan DD-metalloendopeptidase family protein [Flavobacteriaceae bacterium]MDA9827005.1 peptidoglycan DD-metalloendopeptidase family protein [Flavobacteriaceae bacterium]MDA9977940.1 peptidoglycan DD-metalloendopeptidase family protein [Flavobacteriaceae bacterium]MDB4024529.1 peptidoglycan DD-metalloendopeptidase family protein [Flavobacteriaceae bacterium]